MIDNPLSAMPIPGVLHVTGASRQHAASDFGFDLGIPQDARRTLVMAWLGLGLLALLASGLFSVLLVLSRTPQLQNLFPIADFFRVALVVHVDLSVLVWFLAFGGVWSGRAGNSGHVRGALCAGRYTHHGQLCAGS